MLELPYKMNVSLELSYIGISFRTWYRGRSVSMSGDDGSVSSECDEAGATQAPAGLGSATQMPNIVPLYHLVSGSESYPGIAELCAKPEAEVRLGRLGDAPIGVNHANVDTISRHHVTLS